ncbi:OPT oligopeptide transporter protein-domain-containing protein [Gorgonomyces haynaldii]|nr:OPT oligopeptide transporter protein-domain-containing protein [Gorgonomyces haynaldii]
MSAKDAYGLETYSSVESLPEQQKDEFLPEDDGNLEFPGENSIIPEVAATIPVTDDATMPSLTWRVMVIGTLLCIATSIVSQYFFFRLNDITLSSLFHIVVSYPMGISFAKVLPHKLFGVVVNPGPFSIKEHTLIVIIASSAVSMSYGMIVIITKSLFYSESNISVAPALALLLTTQLLGFGLAGILQKLLVYPAKMWWPEQIVVANLLVNFHSGISKSVTSNRVKWFGILFLVAFVYQFLPSFFMPTLQAVSLICLIAGGPSGRLNDQTVFGKGPPADPNMPFLAQVASGFDPNGHGGVGVLTFDWTTISILSPLYTPWWAQVNTLVGNYLFAWITIPLFILFNVWDARNFPAFSVSSFQPNGTRWDVRYVVNPTNFTLIESRYTDYQFRLSPAFALEYGLNFAVISSTVAYMVLYYRSDILKSFKEVDIRDQDVHTKMMKKYTKIPQLVYLSIFISMVGLSMFTVEYFQSDFQLKWWGILLAVGITMLFVVPIGIIRAISSTSIGLNVFSQILIGYFQPGPLANLTFKAYGTNTMNQTLSLLSDLKLSYYMKVPPTHMFICQVYGAVLAAIFNLFSFYYMVDHIPEIRNSACFLKYGARGDGTCNPVLDPQWQSPRPGVLYTASLLYGVVGPVKLFFAPDAPYQILLWFILGGVVISALFYYLHRLFPNVGFNYINIPIIFQQSGVTLYGYGSSILSGTIVGFLSQVYARKYHRLLYDRYNYILSAALDFAAVCVPITLFILSMLNPAVSHLTLDPRRRRLL